MEHSRPGQAVLEVATTTRRALIVMNPSVDSCSPPQITSILSNKLDHQGWSCQVVEVESVAQLDQAAQQARHQGYELVVVAGGDGTIARVASQLVGSDIPLAILPVGRENSLSRNLGIPQDADQAASLLIEDHETGHMDSLQVGDRHFFLQVGTAVAPATGHGASGAELVETDEPATLGAALRKTAGFESRRFSVLVDGRHYRVGAWQVIVVNTGAFGSELLQWGPPIHPSDGVAELIVLRVRSAKDLLRAGLPFLRRGSEQGVSVKYHRVRDGAIIIPDNPMAVQGDSEAIGSTPIQVKVAPRAVKVIVPRATPGLAAGVSAVPGARRRRRWRENWFRAALLHRLGPVAALDTALYLAVARMPHPRPLNLLMRSLEMGMANGRGWVAGVVAANISNRRRLRRELLNLVPPLWLTTFAIEFFIKPIFVRPRPFAALMLTSVVGPKPSSDSFPSGHSASAFAGAWLLSRRHPRLAPFFYAFAALVAFSRVYQGVHYPGDVVIGAAAGIGLATLNRQIVKRILGRIARRLMR